MSTNNDALGNQSSLSNEKKPEATSADFELSELEAEAVAGGVAEEGNNGCANVLASCGGASA